MGTHTGANGDAGDFPARIAPGVHVGCLQGSPSGETRAVANVSPSGPCPRGELDIKQSKLQRYILLLRTCSNFPTFRPAPWQDLAFASRGRLSHVHHASSGYNSIFPGHRP